MLKGQENGLFMIEGCRIRTNTHCVYWFEIGDFTYMHLKQVHPIVAVEAIMTA